jgi:hypothetical protein
MYFPDLGTETQITREHWVRAVGWLATGNPFPSQVVPREFIERLRAICAHWEDATEALRWPTAGGPHQCEFCKREWTSGNIGVPGECVLYVAPEMVAHYVEVHGYSPPTEFVEAVMRCPLPGTSEYMR